MTKETREFVLKLVSLALGVGLICLAVLAPGLTLETRIAIGAAGGVLAGLPVNPFKGGGSNAAVGFACLLLLPSLTSCSGPPPRLPDAEDVAAVQRDVADAEAKVTELAAKVAAAKAKALKSAHDAIAMVRAARSLAISTGVVTREVEDSTAIALQHAESVLGRYERGEAVAKEELLGAVDAVASVASELRKLGRQLEPLVDSSLDLVRMAIEGV